MAAVPLKACCKSRFKTIIEILWAVFLAAIFLFPSRNPPFVLHRSYFERVSVLQRTPKDPCYSLGSCALLKEYKALSAAVDCTMQVVLLQLPLIKDEAQVKTLVKKLGPPLVTLLSEEAEIQYVALRNINLIVQNHPEVLSYEIKVRIPPSSGIH